MRPWLNTTVNLSGSGRERGRVPASMRPWLNTTVNLGWDLRLQRHAVRFNEAVAQHHGEHVGTVPFEFKVGGASMRPWLNTTVNAASARCSWRWGACFNEAVAQHHGELSRPARSAGRGAGRFNEAVAQHHGEPQAFDAQQRALCASMRPWLNTTVNRQCRFCNRQGQGASMRPWLNTTVNARSTPIVEPCSPRLQ